MEGTITGTKARNSFVEVYRYLPKSASIVKLEYRMATFVHETAGFTYG